MQTQIISWIADTDSAVAHNKAIIYLTRDKGQWSKFAAV